MNDTDILHMATELLVKASSKPEDIGMNGVNTAMLSSIAASLLVIARNSTEGKK